MARKSSSGSNGVSSTLSPDHLLSTLNSPASSSSIASTSSAPRPQRTGSRCPPVADENAMQQKDPFANIPFPITYTPTTHRISKAKKGKRVHACEYPGCSKVFTRAEHKRRHELNHNPEAVFRCTHNGCKKTFHRSDLLARHMERHELEARTEGIIEWQPRIKATVASDCSDISECMPVAHGTELYFASTHRPSSVSSGPVATPAIHQEIPATCPLIWNGMDMSFQNKDTMLPYHVPERAEDSPFYSSPETCPSPLSDGASLLLSPLPPPSVSSAPATVIDPYPEDMMKPDLASSPLPTDPSLRCLDPSDPSSLDMPNMVPTTHGGDFIQPNIQCPYPSPPWSAVSLPYGSHSSAMHWKAWNM